VKALKDIKLPTVEGLRFSWLSKLVLSYFKPFQEIYIKT
jgi:hypothetical protein